MDSTLSCSRHQQNGYHYSFGTSIFKRQQIDQNSSIEIKKNERKYPPIKSTQRLKILTDG